MHIYKPGGFYPRLYVDPNLVPENEMLLEEMACVLQLDFVLTFCFLNKNHVMNPIKLCYECSQS